MNSQYGCAMMASVLLAGAAQGQLVIDVAPDASPWLAGHVDGTTIGTRGVLDAAPDQSPPMFSVLTGERLTFFATGMTRNTPNNPFVGPDGSASIAPVSVEIDDLNGFTNVVAPMSSLVGVFTGAASSGGAPGLDFSTAGSRDFGELSPQLNQIFFVGDGLTSAGAVQEFVVPFGATTLHLGFMDRFGWSNNEGSLEVSVTHVIPTPGSAVLALVAVGSLGARRRR